MDHLWTPWRMAYLRGESDKPDGCIFCHKIGADDDAEFVVFRSEHVYVTLNRFPYNNGHLLIVPYAHIGEFTALPLETLTDLMRTTQEAIVALRTVYNPAAFNVGLNLGAAAGAGVAEHLHLHIVPRWPGDASYLSVIAGTRVIPDLLEDTYRSLRAAWPARGVDSSGANAG
ncbi:MAG: HIT domain-containing protein [Anaerolineae bacterium]|nr:HIT domain-containing protein [Anaerolineae bacterium]